VNGSTGLAPKGRIIAPPVGLMMITGDMMRRVYNASNFEDMSVS